MSITVGSVLVEVLPDTSTFAEKLKAKLATIRGITIDVDVDTSAAETRLEELSHSRSATINVKVDDGIASAELDRLARDRTANIRVNATQGAGAGDTGGLPIGPLGFAIGAGVLAAPSVGAAAIGALAGVATSLGAIGAGAITAKLGLSGVGDAIKAIDNAQKSSSASAVALGAARAALANTIANADDAAVRSAESVAVARQGVADASRAAAAGVASAIRSEVSSEQAVQSAQRASAQAQRDLIQAREDARRQLVDLSNATKDGALSERQAVLDIQKAKEDLTRARVDPTLTARERAQAQLTYEQAVQHLADLRVRNGRLATEKKAADKAGIDGSKQVLAATQNLAAAEAQVHDAQAAQVLAAKAVTEARRSGAESVAKAERQVTDALRAQVSTARNSAAAIASAHRAVAAAGTGSTSAQAQAAALAALTPAGRAFVRFYESQIKPRIKELRDTAQAGLLPGLQAGIASALPVFGVLKDIVHNASVAVGNLLRDIGKALASPFWQGFLASIRDNIGPAIKTTGDILGGLATAFAGLFQAFLPNSRQMGSDLGDLADKFAKWATTLDKNKGFQDFLKYVNENGPVVFGLIGQLAKTFIDINVALAPMSTNFLKIVSLIAKVIDSIVKVVGAVLHFVDVVNRATSPEGIQKGIRIAVDFIGRKFDDLVGFFGGVGPKIAEKTVGMFDGLKDAFKSALNFIVDGWNGIEFKLPGIDTHIPGVGKIGGFTLGTPDIPRLAQGGIITSPTIALVGEAGPEAVIPLAQMDAFAKSLRGGAFAPGSAGGTGVVVNQTINNPVPERASTSGPVGIRRAALALGR